MPPPTKAHTSRSRAPAATGTWPAARERAQRTSRSRATVARRCRWSLFARDGQGNAGALLDRCPHRNVPLSLGRVARTGRLECRYHGWQFDGSGRCRHVPGRKADDDNPERRAPACARAREGRLHLGVARRSAPSPRVSTPACQLGLDASAGYTTVVREVSAQATSARHAGERARRPAHGVPASRAFPRRRGTPRDPRDPAPRPPSLPKSSTWASRGRKAWWGACCHRAEGRWSTGIASSCRRSLRWSTGSAGRRISGSPPSARR